MSMTKNGPAWPGGPKTLNCKTYWPTVKTLEELSTSLALDESTVCRCLHAMREIQKKKRKPLPRKLTEDDFGWPHCLQLLLTIHCCSSEMGSFTAPRVLIRHGVASWLPLRCSVAWLAREPATLKKYENVSIGESMAN